MKTEIAKDIEHAGAMIQYDAQCKKVLSNKYVLPWIMKAAIKEYAALSHDFIRYCIEGEPEVSGKPIEAGDIQEKIEGLPTEDKDAVEGMITYDIHYTAYMPKEAQMVKILINVEAQKSFYPGYPIESRGVYYGARMISSQNGVEFKEPAYGEIKKVYTIWICMNVPKYVGNAISVYELQKQDLIEGMPDHHEDYDKLAMIIICLNGKVEHKNNFFDMMNTLLSPKMDVETKKKILRNEYLIPMETGFVKELDLMCNLSEWVLQTGIEQGMETQRKEITENLLREGFPDEVIMKVTAVTAEKLKECKERILCMA